MPARNLTYCPTAVCSLFTAHSTLAEIYAFSAKERDVETGLSYFGARYYSSDLSIWLSVDPMSGKYPHQSNYVYCSNNPIIVIDPNGMKDEPYNTKKHKPFTPTSHSSTATPIKGIVIGKMTISYDMQSWFSCYNCHSFAWHDAKGDKNPGILDIPTALDGTSLFRWDNSPADDIKEQKAIQLEENEDNIIGDKVIYYTDVNNNGKYDDGEDITHSAVVSAVDENGCTIEVTAKCGQDGIYSNHPDAPEYYKYDKDGNPTKRAYFRVTNTSGE